jgi:molybdate-binding protein
MILATLWLAQIDPEDAVITRSGYRNVQGIIAAAAIPCGCSSFDIFRAVVTCSTDGSGSGTRICLDQSLIEFDPLCFAGTVTCRIGDPQRVRFPA